jgi:hypothetical protein
MILTADSTGPEQIVQRKPGMTCGRRGYSSAGPVHNTDHGSKENSCQASALRMIAVTVLDLCFSVHNAWQALIQGLLVPTVPTNLPGSLT